LSEAIIPFWTGYLAARRREFDIVHVHLLHAHTVAGVLSGMWLKKPVVVKIGNSGTPYSPRWFLQTKGQTFKSFPHIFTKKLHGIITNRYRYFCVFFYKEHPLEQFHRCIPHGQVKVAAGTWSDYPPARFK
jgi:hypothetical protein